MAAMRYRLRTLLILLAVGPLMLAVAIFFLALHGFIPGIGVTSNGEVKALPR
jgi:hypothetical protein